MVQQFHFSHKCLVVNIYLTPDTLWLYEHLILFDFILICFHYITKHLLHLTIQHFIGIADNQGYIISTRMLLAAHPLHFTAMIAYCQLLNLTFPAVHLHLTFLVACHLMKKDCWNSGNCLNNYAKFTQFALATPSLCCRKSCGSH